MNEKPVYTQKAPIKNSAVIRIAATLALVGAFALLLFVIGFLPYSGILTLAALFLFAVCTQRMLSGMVFDITYTLYEDRLVFVRRYGKIEGEGEVFPFDEAKFFADKIEHRGKTYDFSPDEKLKQLLNL